MNKLKITIDEQLIDLIYDETLFAASCSYVGLSIYINSALTRAINNKIRKHAILGGPYEKTKP